MAERLKLTPKLARLLHSLTWEMQDFDELPQHDVDALRIDESDLDHPEGRLSADQLTAVFDGLLSEQKGMYANVVRMRFGIGVNSDFTLEEIGRRHEVTRERIRQIEQKVLGSLRQNPKLKALHQILHGEHPGSQPNHKKQSPRKSTETLEPVNRIMEAMNDN